MSTAGKLVVGDLDEKGKKSVLDSELQDFAMQVSMICALEAGGKLNSVEAYKKIKIIFKELKSTKRALYPKAVPTPEK